MFCGGVVFRRVPWFSPFFPLGRRSKTSSAGVNLPSPPSPFYGGSRRGGGKGLPRAEVERLMRTMPSRNIRTFSIIAHVDHGKSTLSDRFLQTTGTIPPDAPEQYLDSLEVERSRGITVKAQTCTMFWENPGDGETYVINLIDTPGHSDFSYEVSRSLAACQGALLLVDSTQGIQAQTVANFYLAFANDLVIVGACSKIDIPRGRQLLPETKAEVARLADCPPDAVSAVSAKTGEGVVELLQRVIREIPPPVGDPDAPLRALLFDCSFVQGKGTVLLVCVQEGCLKKGAKVLAFHSSLTFQIEETGILHPPLAMTSLESLQAGQVGYAVVTLKQTRDVRVGDTLFIASDVMPSEHAGGPPRPPSDPIPAFQPARQMVWAGVFPEDPSQSDALQQAMGRVMLSDAAISATPEVSEALGLGFRCGFLGLLHLDVFKQRMEGEFGVKVIACAPTVPFRVGIGRGEGEEVRVVESAAQFPDVVTRCEEPLCEATILVPQAYLKNVEVLCIERRGEQTRIEFLSGGGG
eukprot:Cvel_28378.t1-p1 / transcript=Cvel_28378.t1 / gene=Cvel_28378 / organism=Chromera_velia_CCMP2878 / gene_product=Translation factor GUF1 homolog, mitochondrial, putative / transcript_product=Translation factor GUF1 homolog, mitochondrial, putative / location=Cvel_scaffold3703:1-1566(-) / protein_length=522 / sequence_SO=supercontig / SO=protein_coding / is_pseudo=false